MGYIIEIKCKNCNHSEELFLGYGRNDISPESFLNKFHMDIQNKLPFEFEKGGWNYNKKLGYCDRCKKYIAVPTVEILDSENIYIDTCECGNQPTVVADADSFEQGDITIPCPKCNKEAIVSMIGHWD